MGNTLGMIGVSAGVVSAFANTAPAVMPQLAGALVGGGALGYAIQSKVGPSELPQTVAAFHSLVGLAAVGTAVGDYGTFLADPAAHQMDAVHSTGIYLADFIGGVTFTGSIVAFGKLHGLSGRIFESTPLALENRDQINAGLAGVSGLGLVAFVGAPESSLAGAALATTTVSSGILGAHMTASIGGLCLGRGGANKLRRVSLESRPS